MNYSHSDDSTLKSFRETYKDLERVYDSFSKICGLSNTEYWALLMIYEGVATQHDISESLCLSRQTVNSAFRQLIKKDLIRLESVENNLRVKKAYLTKDGVKFVEKYVGNMHGLEEMVWHMMKEEERVQLTRLIRKYKTLMKESLEEYQNSKNSSSEDLQS